MVGAFQREYAEKAIKLFEVVGQSPDASGALNTSLAFMIAFLCFKHRFHHSVTFTFLRSFLATR